MVEGRGQVILEEIITLNPCSPMNAQKSSSDSRPNKPIPVIPAPASVLPKQYAKDTPMDEERLDRAKRESTRAMGGLAAGPGEDPTNDSGMPAYEPVRPKQLPEEQSNR
jgi:hypothetical protein